jgi:pimeloyl-ACP methyl ester carboxylesterase
MSNERTASINGIDLHFEIRGEGTPLLMLHGFTGCHEDWQYAGRDVFEREFELVLPDARGHGRSTNPDGAATHARNAADVLALLDHLGISRCKAVGMSFGANTLLHVATLAPERIQAMVLVSGTLHFPESARRIMAASPVDDQPPEAWEAMRARHKLGDEQILELWKQQRAFKDDYEDVNFTAAELSRITARTLVVYGDRDPLYPVEMGVAMYRAIQDSALWVVPRGGHGPIFLEAAQEFALRAVEFLGAE